VWPRTTTGMRQADLQIGYASTWPWIQGIKIDDIHLLTEIQLSLSLILNDIFLDWLQKTLVCRRIHPPHSEELKRWF